MVDNIVGRTTVGQRALADDHPPETTAGYPVARVRATVTVPGRENRRLTANTSLA